MSAGQLAEEAASAALTFAEHHPLRTIEVVGVGLAVYLARRVWTRFTGRRAAEAAGVPPEPILSEFLLLLSAAGGVLVLATQPWRTAPAAAPAAVPRPTVTRTTIIEKTASAAHPFVTSTGFVIIVCVVVCGAVAVAINYVSRRWGGD